MREQSFCSMFLPTMLVRLLIVSENFNLDCPHKWWSRLSIQILINFIFSELSISICHYSVFLNYLKFVLLLYCQNFLYILNPRPFDVHLVRNNFFTACGLPFAFLEKNRYLFVNIVKFTDCQYLVSILKDIVFLKKSHYPVVVKLFSSV